MKKDYLRSFRFQRMGWIVICLALLIGILPAAMAQRGIIRPSSKVRPVLVHIYPQFDAEAVAQQYGSTILDRVPDTNIYSLSVPRGQTSQQFADLLALDTVHFLFAETDKELVTPETEAIRKGTPKQQHLAFDGGGNAGGYLGQGAYYQVNVNEAHEYSKGYGVVVAVLDTGATFSHPDLKDHYLPGYNVLNPGQPPLDLPDGRDNVAVGHGTMVAGIIARVAPGAKIMPVRVLNGDGTGSMLDVVKGIYYAKRHGAQIINMSFGTIVASSALNEAKDEAEIEGVITVASAGNNGLEQRQFPAHGQSTIAVASVEEDNRKSDFSNYGGDVLVCAPGRNIWSTYWTGGYASWSGTSFAAPFVAGQVALLLSMNPAFTEDAISDIIKSTAQNIDYLNPAYRGELGEGVIDILAAVRRALTY